LAFQARVGSWLLHIPSDVRAWESSAPAQPPNANVEPLKKAKAEVSDDLRPEYLRDKFAPWFAAGMQRG
jgi:hypothetical protein